MSNFLGFPRKIVLFVLNCKNLKILRDFCDFGSYISYGGSLRAERPARRGFAVAKGKTGSAVLLQLYPVYVIPVQSRPALVQVSLEVHVAPLYQDNL